MYLNILKRDLKRKKTMNVILLLFIILATTFVSSSVNNMVSITSALDNYFDIANVPDFTTITLQKGTTENIEDVLDSIEEVDSYEIEELIAMSYEDFTFHSSDEESGGSYFLTSFRSIILYIVGGTQNVVTLYFSRTPRISAPSNLSKS